MATYESASASRADVLTAYGLCSTGDTLKVKAGAATWTAAIEIAKAITIDGTGVTLTSGASLTEGFFYLHNLTSTSLLRITGFTFECGDSGKVIYTDGMDLTQLRIDHNTFNKANQCLWLLGCKGVIDNNYFHNCWQDIEYSAGTRAQADASWVSMAAGTGDALFIEDNDFVYDADWTAGAGNYAILDTHNGGKLVIRYNTIDTTAIPAGFTDQFWTFQLHGSAAAGGEYGYWQANAGTRRGQSVFEMYENTITGKQVGRLITLRGSASLIWNNTQTCSSYGVQVVMYEEEWSLSQWDPLRTAWPAEDQIHNTFFWGNVFNGSPQAAGHFNVVSGNEDYIQQDRDFFLHRPATTGEGMTLGKETFTGLNGASGSYPTNGVVHPTYGTMAFTADVENAYYGYVPYTYPHPLQAETSTAPWVMIYG